MAIKANYQIIDGRLRKIEHTQPTDRTAVPPLDSGSDYLSQATLLALSAQFSVSPSQLLNGLVAARNLVDERER